jgi:hypothetical protein
LEIFRRNIFAGPCDDNQGEIAIDVTAPTMMEAWESFCKKLNDVGQCNNCGIITYTADGCRPCALRSAIGIKVECTICKLSKNNPYQLKCGHSICRDCAKRCAVTGTDCGGDELRKCPFRCHRPFLIHQGLKEMEGCDCDIVIILHVLCLILNNIQIRRETQPITIQYDLLPTAKTTRTGIKQTKTNEYRFLSSETNET